MFTQADETIIWQRINSVRQQFANYLSMLSEDQWNQASACDGWKVRDVVAHLILEYQYSAKKDWPDFVKSSFNVNRFMKQTAVKYGRQPTADLLAAFEAMVNQRQKPSAVSVINVLADLLIHEQDIRLPLNHPKAMPLDSLRLIFEHWEPTNFNLGEKLTGIAARTKGLQFIIEDLGITKGDGAPVIGNAQDIIMAVVGRKTSLHNLGGQGSKKLKTRIL